MGERDNGPILAGITVGSSMAAAVEGAMEAASMVADSHGEQVDLIDGMTGEHLGTAYPTPAGVRKVTAFSSRTWRAGWKPKGPKRNWGWRPSEPVD